MKTRGGLLIKSAFWLVIASCLVLSSPIFAEPSKKKEFSEKIDRVMDQVDDAIQAGFGISARFGRGGAIVHAFEKAAALYVEVSNNPELDDDKEEDPLLEELQGRIKTAWDRLTDPFLDTLGERQIPETMGNLALFLDAVRLNTVAAFQFKEDGKWQVPPGWFFIGENSVRSRIVKHIVKSFGTYLEKERKSTNTPTEKTQTADALSGLMKALASADPVKNFGVLKRFFKFSLIASVIVWLNPFDFFLDKSFLSTFWAAVFDVGMLASFAKMHYNNTGLVAAYRISKFEAMAEGKRSGCIHQIANLVMDTPYLATQFVLQKIAQLRDKANNSRGGR